MRGIKRKGCIMYMGRILEGRERGNEGGRKGRVEMVRERTREVD